MNKKYSKRLACFFCLLCVSAFSAPYYTISDLDMQDLANDGKTVSNSYACAINNNGQVVGTCSTTSPRSIDTHHTFIWDKEHGLKIIDSGNLHRRAPCINNLGFVAGMIYPSSGDHNASWYFWHESLGLVSQPGYFMIDSLNDSNNILGTMLSAGSQPPYSYPQANFFGIGDILNGTSRNQFPDIERLMINHFNKIYKEKLVQRHGLIKLDGFSVTTCPIAINNHNEVLCTIKTIVTFWKGTKKLAERGEHHVMVTGTKVTEISGAPFALNDRGDVGLESVLCHRIAMNNFGEIVGKHGSQPNQFSFVTNTEGTFNLLDQVVDNEVWSALLCATGINDVGQIVGYGLRKDRKGIHAFLLTPINPEAHR